MIKHKKNKRFFQAVAVMLGYVIGVGMFGVPYIVANSGVWSFLFFLVLLVPVMYTVHLIYASMILATKHYHRMPGYAGHYLGKKSKMIVFATKVFGNWGGLLAYIIITGIFLHTLFSPYLGGEVWMYTTVIFLLESLIVYLGISMIARVELIMTLLLLSVVTLISYRGLEFADISNFVMNGPASFLLPYGAMLMALDGNGALPMVAKLVDRDPKMMRKVIQLSTVIVAVVLVMFTFSIVSLSGPATSPDALSGLAAKMNGIVTFALFFGVICMVTSFMGVSESIKETFNWDFGFSEKLSWALAVLVPFILYVIGIRDLTEVVTFVGAVGGGLSAIMMIFIYRKIKDKRIVSEVIKMKPSVAVQALLIFLFVAGFVANVI